MLAKTGLFKAFLRGPAAASRCRLVWKREICIILSLMQHILRKDNQFSLNIIVLCSAQHKFICHLLLVDSSRRTFWLFRSSDFHIYTRVCGTIIVLCVGYHSKILLIYLYMKKGLSRHGFYSVSFSCQATAMRYEWLYGSLGLVSFGHTRILIRLRRSRNWSVWCMESDIGYIH